MTSEHWHPKRNTASACLYERLGRKAEAQRAFQAVVNQYGDQAEVVRRARAKIPAPVAYGNSTVKGKGRITDTGASGKAANGIAVRQVWAVPPETDAGSGTLSPDGRYLSFIDWETGDLAVRDLTTGENRRLTNKGSYFSSIEYAEYSTVSPDAKQVAYAWYNKDKFYDLRIIGIDGSKPRVLYRNEEVYVHPFAWSPDGKYVLTLFSKKDKTD